MMDKVNKQDTTIIDNENILDESNGRRFYAKSYSYYWVAGKDTLDFQLLVTEHEANGAVGISIIHNNPVTFEVALERLNACFGLIGLHFELSHLTLLYFRSPTRYADLSKELSHAFTKKFGAKHIGYQRLNQFLLASDITSRLDRLLAPLDKKVQRYGIEKFHLMKKENYPFYQPDAVLADYAERIIDGMSIAVYM